MASNRGPVLRSSRSPSRSHSRNRVHLRRRLVQARRGPPLRRHHGQQERMGLRLLQVHHAVGDEVGLHSSNHDEWKSGAAVVSVRRRLLEVWKDVQEVDQGFKGPHYVKRCLLYIDQRVFLHRAIFGGAKLGVNAACECRNMNSWLPSFCVFSPFDECAISSCIRLMEV